MADGYPLHVVTAWLGNTPKVADRHYLTVTEEHFQTAAKGVVQQSVLQDSAHACTDAPDEDDKSHLQPVTAVCNDVQHGQVPPAGFEPAACALGKRRSIQLSYGGGEGWHPDIWIAARSPYRLYFFSKSLPKR